MNNASPTMVCSPRVLATGVVLTWVGWTMVSNYIFLNLELYQSEFMFRVVASMGQISLLFIAFIAYHIKTGKRVWETLTRLLFFGFILGIIIGPGNVIAHQAISQSGSTLFLVTTLSLLPICWAVNYCMSVEPFNKTQATLLAVTLATLFWMYTTFGSYNSTYVVTRNDSYTLYFELFKAEGVTSGFFFSFYLAMVLLMFEMALPFLNGPFDILNQVFLMQIFSFLFNLAGVFKYEKWNLEAVTQPEVLPYLALYIVLDCALITGLFLSVHPDFEKHRFYLLMRAPLGAFLSMWILGEQFDATTMIGGGVLLICSAFGEYAKYMESMANQAFAHGMPPLHVQPEAIQVDTSEPVTTPAQPVA